MEKSPEIIYQLTPLLQDVAIIHSIGKNTWGLNTKHPVNHYAGGILDEATNISFRGEKHHSRNQAFGEEIYS